MKLCQNVMYNTDNINLPQVKCYRKAAVIKRPGTCCEIHLCADCANGENKLLERAKQKWRDLGWVENGQRGTMPKSIKSN